LPGSGVVSKKCFANGGTEGSNPSPSSEESGANSCRPPCKGASHFGAAHPDLADAAWRKNAQIVGSTLVLKASLAGSVGLFFDLSSRELFSPLSKEVRLTTGEFDLLAAFVNNPNQVLTRDQLLHFSRDREAGQWLGQIVAGYFAYHAVPTNSAAISAFRYHVIILWHRRLRRRSQRTRLVWTQMAKLADEFLPKPRILHPWPSVRFAVRHPR
jgi:hypothetical protein